MRPENTGPTEVANEKADRLSSLSEAVRGIVYAVTEKPQTRWKLRCKNKRCGGEFDISPTSFRSNKKHLCPHCGKPSTYHTPDILKATIRSPIES